VAGGDDVKGGSANLSQVQATGESILSNEKTKRILVT
jgi:hypothetical protein